MTSLAYNLQKTNNPYLKGKFIFSSSSIELINPDYDKIFSLYKDLSIPLALTPCRNLLQKQQDIDISSESTFFESFSDTNKTDIVSDEDIFSSMLENDYIVRMSPLKEYKVKVKVDSIKRATPIIFTPEDM